MHSFPFSWMNCHVGEHISCLLGTIEHVNVDQNGIRWGQFLRIRVSLDFTKPLVQGKSLMVQDIQFGFYYGKKDFLFLLPFWIIKHSPSGCLVPPQKILHGGSSRDHNNINLESLHLLLQVFYCLTKFVLPFNLFIFRQEYLFKRMLWWGNWKMV